MTIRMTGAFAAMLIMMAAAMNGAMAAGSDIVSLYSDLQSRGGFGLNYRIERTGGGWSTFNSEWKTRIPVRVDLRNGYLYFTDEGTGGGNFDTQARLFHKSSGAPMLVIVENGYNPPYPEDTKTRLFSKSGSAWQDDTGWMWPKLSLDDFLTDEMTIADLRAMKALRAKIYVSLPPKGRVPVAYLVVNETMTRAVCGGDKSFVVKDKAPYLRYCNQLKDRLFNAIEIDWNTERDRFEAGRKTRVNLNWNKR